MAKQKMKQIENRNENDARVAERRKVVEDLFQQLLEKVPTCRIAQKNRTAKQLEEFYNRAFEKVNYDNVLNYIQQNKGGLQLKKDEIPDGLWFALILYGIYGRKNFTTTMDVIFGWNDKMIFDLSDNETNQELTSIEKLLKAKPNSMLFHMEKEKFFRRIVEIREFLCLLEKTGF